MALAISIVSLGSLDGIRRNSSGALVIGTGAAEAGLRKTGSGGVLIMERKLARTGSGCFS